MKAHHSLWQHLSEVFKVDLSGDAPYQCPKCERHTLRFSGEALVKCISLGCQFHLTPVGIDAPHLDIYQRMLWKYVEDCHQNKLYYLVNSSKTRCPAIEIMRQRLPEQIIKEHITLGIVPEQFNWDGFIRPFVEELIQKEEFSKAFLNSVEYLKERAKPGWIACFQPDSNQGIASMKFYPPDAWPLSGLKRNPESIDDKEVPENTSDESLDNAQLLNDKTYTACRPVEDVKQEVLKFLANSDKKNKIPIRLIPHNIGELLVAEFKKRGEFLQSELGPYYRSQETLKVYLIHSSSTDFGHLLHSFGLNPALKEHEFVLNEMAQEAFTNGRPTEIHWLHHYDPKANILYYYNLDKQVFRISQTDIQEGVNGMDGILFQPPPGYQPFNWVEVDSQVDFFQDYILKYANFSTDGLSQCSSQLLLRYWMLGLPFDTLHPTRPLVTFLGEKGSGKTSLAKRIGQLLVGTAFSVSTLPSKPDELDALITNQPYVVLDNVDDTKSWLNDRLACVATGGTVERRQLYTTNQLAHFRIRSVLMITTRTPQFRRDDVADRLLIFKLDGLEHNIPESRLIQEIRDGRDAFMSWYLLQLQQVVQKLALYPEVESEFRMADFASFCLRLAMAEGESARGEMENILKQVTGTQVRFSVEDNPLGQLLLAIAEIHPGQKFLASELLEKIKTLAQDQGHTLPDGLTAVTLGRQLSRGLPELKGLLRIDSQKGSHNQCFYELTLLN